MIILFEGCRNSGKSYMGTKVSDSLGIPRFQFDFAKYFSDLKLVSSGDSGAQNFAIGKELMLLQLERDGFIPGNIIVDRGFLTVLAWGILEKRITYHQAFEQLDMLYKNGLLRNVCVFYIDGDNPQKRKTAKDSWDFAESDSRESDAYKTIFNYIEEKKYDIKINIFRNNFDDESLKRLIKEVNICAV